jgi:hypothetical protein
MTLINDDYVAEILGGLRAGGTEILHAFLDLDPAVLGADDHRQAVRRAGHRGVGRVGQAPGRGTSPDAGLGFPRIRATVAPAPHDAHARTQYRRS